MFDLKDTIPLFFISFSVGITIGRIYLNEKRIYNFERNIFILENKVDDLRDDLLKK